MDENRRRREAIAKLAVVTDAVPALLAKVDRVLALPFLSKTQSLDIELISVRVGSIFLELRQVLDEDGAYDTMVSCATRLREQVKVSNAALDALLTHKHRVG